MSQKLRSFETDDQAMQHLVTEYELDYDHLLGEGGFGKVYKGRALDLKLPEHVVVKVIQRDSKKKYDYLHQHEIEMMLKLSAQPKLKPLIPIIFEAFKSPNYYYLVMEYVGKCSLHQLITPGHSKCTDKIPYFTPKEKMKVARQLLRAVQTLHEHGVYHLDIKPSNIMMLEQKELRKGKKPLKRYTRPVIIDFGLSCYRPPGGRALEDSECLVVHSGTSTYFPHYLLDEKQLRQMSRFPLKDKEMVGRERDMFAMAVTLWNLITDGLDPLPHSKYYLFGEKEPTWGLDFQAPDQILLRSYNTEEERHLLQVLFQMVIKPHKRGLVAGHIADAEEVLDELNG